MTPEAQRIAIAEACGWKPAKSTGIIYHGWQKEGVSKFRHTYQLPDYLSDLNAMHEAAKTLTGKNRAVYGEHLATAAGLYDDYYEGWNLSTEDFVRVSQLTAEQLAYAFLRTLNLWPDEVERT